MTDVPRGSTGILPKGMAGITIAAPAAAQSLPDTFAKLIGWTANIVGSEGSTPDQANARVTINRPGDYMVVATVCGVMPTNNREYHFDIHKNQAPSLFGTCFTAESNGHMDAATIVGMLECVAGDEIELFALCTTNGTDFTLQRAQLMVVRLAG